jgi:hypothetical protein
MGLGNYLNKQHSSNLLSRRSSILQVPSGWCTVIAVARICASMAASDRGSGQGEISPVVNEASGTCPPISRTRRRPAHNVASPFGREKILPDADWRARIGRGKRARIVRKYERHALTQAYTVPILGTIVSCPRRPTSRLEHDP